MDANWTTRVRLRWRLSHETEADLICGSAANKNKGGSSLDEEDTFDPRLDAPVDDAASSSRSNSPSLNSVRNRTNARIISNMFENETYVGRCNK